MSVNVVLIGAGSREFGHATINDLLLSDTLEEEGLDIILMDLDAKAVSESEVYARRLAQRLRRKARVRSTTSLDDALSGARFVISAIEIGRYHFWAQDFHVPRKYGFRQIYGENGGPGGLFHALRNMGPTVEIALRMTELCPDAILLNYTNPLTKLCEAVSRLTDVRFIGLCHGVFQGMRQVARFLRMPVEDLSAKASGLNHITWFQELKHAQTGEDLYPRLRSAEKEAHWLSEWDELALSRILFRTFGLYPSPGANHIGEYIGWASEFLASAAMQFFYDRREGAPWTTGRVPTWIYNLDAHPTDTPMFPAEPVIALSPKKEKNSTDVQPSGELAIPIIESLSVGVRHHLNAVNIRNDGYVPGLPTDAVVEVPATSDGGGVLPETMPELPRGILAILRTQTTINELLVEAFQRSSREALLQAILLDPAVDSYHRAVDMTNEMCELQKDVLPELTW